MNTWLVLGSSTNAKRMLPVAQADCPDATTISTNDAIALMTPDYFFLDDTIACRQYAEEARRLQDTTDLQLITVQRTQSAMENRGVWTAQHQLRPIRQGGQSRFIRGAIYTCFYSGLYCVQFALLRGAERLLLVGHEGYPTDDGPVYFTDTCARPRARAWTEPHLGPWWQSCIDACPDVEFRFYGELQMQLTGDNVTRIPCHDRQARQASNDQAIHRGPRARTDQDDVEHVGNRVGTGVARHKQGSLPGGTDRGVAAIPREDPQP